MELLSDRTWFPDYLIAFSGALGCKVNDVVMASVTANDCAL